MGANNHGRLRHIGWEKCGHGLGVDHCASSGSLHWPSEDKDLGFDGVSYLELLILNELWAGERLICAKSIPRRSKSGRGISVSAATVSPGVEILKSCRFLCYVLRFLGDLLRIRRFLCVTWAATMEDSGILVGKGLGKV